jgi:uncharacterized protein YkwD
MSASTLTFTPRHVCSFACVVAVVSCGLTLVGSAPARAAATSTAADCANVDLAPTAANTKEIRAAVLCLINAERAQRGRVALRKNPRLRRAALAHSSDMVRDGYFAHTAPNGDTFVDRILHARYTRRSDGWSLGENLAWGTGELGTARGVTQAWMRSSGHRANILKRSYRNLGIGVHVGVPRDAGVGATFTIDFGVRA